MGIPPYRFALCNELFQHASFDSVCRSISEIGYQGIEIAPFTLAENPAALTKGHRSRLRQIITHYQLTFVGLHWLLVSPKGLHATTPDKDLRQRTWAFIGDLIDLCADLHSSHDGNGALMVFGSPQQRSTVAGMKPAEAKKILTQELARAGNHAANRGVMLLLEPLSPSQTDVVTSLAEAVSIVEAIGNPAVQTMFDVHNAVAEPDPHNELLRRYLPHIRHVHVNEMDGREPGTGDYDFSALLSTLAELNYSGWVSLEVFDFSRDARQIGAGAIERLDRAAHSSCQTI